MTPISSSLPTRRSPAGWLMAFLSQFLSCHWAVLANVDNVTMRALEDFYFATDGPNWVYPINTSSLTKWHFPIGSGRDPCADGWSGLGCSPRGSACTDTVPCVVLGINLTKYRLQGTLPASISRLINMTYLKLENNKLWGRLNFESLYPIAKLIDIRVNENSFSGSFPSDIYRLSSLGLLKLRANKFVGTVPPAFGNLSRLFEVHLSLNNFSGTIPTTLQHLSHTLTYLSFRNNAFTGTIPSILGSLNRLKQLSLYNNSLVGTIPPSLGSLSSLNLLVLHSNQLRGTIPPELGLMKSLGGLYLHRNFLNGTVPSELFLLSNLNEFDLSTNNLHGSLPERVGTMRSIHLFRVRQNKLLGTIPEEARLWPNLTEFDVSENSLTGSFPTFFALARRLQKVNIRSNQLSGSLLMMDQMKSFPGLESIDVSSNKFSGGLPEELFQSNSLKFFDASQNCFNAEIGDFLCSGNIQTLSLNGLSLAKSCRIKLDDEFNLFRASLTRATRGRLPRCLLEKPGVIQVYMEGNRLQGDLEEIVVAKNLTELGLGSNELKGRLPRSVLLHPFRFLDLSYNKFEGDLGAVDESCSLSVPESNMTRLMTVNRFSNMVPQCYYNLANIDVAGGNHFNCNDEYRLPAEDPSSDSTICGSQDFELSVILYLCLCALGAVFVVCFARHNGVIKGVYREAWMFAAHRSAWLSLSDIDAPGLRNFGSTTHGILKTSAALGLLVVIACAILSAVLSDTFYLITNAYGWKLSMVMLIGWQVSLGYAILWCSVMGFCFYVSLLQLVRWQEGPDSSGRLLAFPSSVERFGGETQTINPCLKDIRVSADTSLFCGERSEISALTREDSKARDDREIVADPPLSNVGFAVHATVKVEAAPSGFDGPKYESFEVSMRDTKMAESYHVYKTETASHEGMEMKASIVGKSLLVLFTNALVSIFLNVLYSRVLYSDLDASLKLFFQFAFAVATTLWNKGGVGFLIKKVRTSFRLQVLLNIAMNVINTIVVPCLTMLVTSDYCFNGLFQGVGEISVVVMYEECVVTTFSNGNVECTERGPAVSINTFSRPFVYNGGCSQAVLAAYIPVFILSYAIDLVACPIGFAVIAKYFENFDIIPVPHMLWVSSTTQGYQLLRGHQLFIILFQHILMLLTFGIASPVLALVIVIGAVADAVLYTFTIRRFLGKAKERSDNIDRTGALEAASRQIPRNFMHIYVCIMWVSALFYCGILLDYAIDGSFMVV